MPRIFPTAGNTSIEGSHTRCPPTAKHGQIRQVGDARLYDGSGIYSSHRAYITSVGVIPSFHTPEVSSPRVEM